MRTLVRRLSIVLATACVVAGCTNLAEPTLTPTAETPSPPATSIPTPTPEPISTPTPAPSPTPSPVPSPTFTPTAVPTPTATLTASESAKDAVGASTVRLGILDTWSNGDHHTTDTVGTGLIYHADGYVVTNFHVIEYFLDRAEAEGSDPSDIIGVEVRSVGVGPISTYPGTVLGYDSRRDLAVVKIERDEDFPVAGIGSHAGLRSDDELIALGYPGGFTIPELETLEGEFDTAWQAGGRTLLQHSTRVVGGFSGGPLVDDSGHVVALNAFYVSQADAGGVLPVSVESYALSIAIDDVLANLDAMEDGLMYRGGHTVQFGLLDSSISLPNAWIMNTNTSKYEFEATTQFEAYVSGHAEERDLDQPAREVFAAREAEFNESVIVDPDSVETELFEAFGVSVAAYGSSYRVDSTSGYWFRYSVWLAQGSEIVNLEVRAPIDRYAATIVGIVEGMESISGLSDANISGSIDRQYVASVPTASAAGLDIELDNVTLFGDSSPLSVEPELLTALYSGHVIGRVAVARFRVTNTTDEAATVTHTDAAFTGEDGSTYIPPALGSLIQLLRLEDFGFSTGLGFDFTDLFGELPTPVTEDGAVALSGEAEVPAGESMLLWVAVPMPLDTQPTQVSIAAGGDQASFNLTLDSGN